MSVKTDKMRFILKSGKEIVIDFLSVESILQHKEYLAEVADQLENEWLPLIRENLFKSLIYK